jgi:sugar phosphate isomerase/epimerase
MERRAFLVSAAAALACGGNVNASAERRAALGLGIQLYTLRGEMERDLEATLARVAQIGYREVEFAGYFGRSPQAIRTILDANNLSAPSAHVGLDLLGEQWDATLEAATLIGHRYLVVPFIPEQQRSLDGYRQVAEQLNRAGERARTASITLGYHNHAFEFERTEGQIPFDLLIAETDPDSVVLELDVFWTAKGGADSLAYMTRNSGRVRLIHAKDMDASGNMTDVGKGTLDFTTIVRTGRESGLEHVIVEHDEPADPFATARAGYDHLRAIIT